MAMDFPASPTVGQIVALGGNQYIWDGTAWNILPQQAPAQATDLPPANPAVGQFWWRATNGQLYVYVDDGDSKQWVQAAGQAATPGAWELIGDFQLTAATTLVVTNIGAFRRLRYGFAFTNSAVCFLGLQFSLDNGATFRSGASDYSNQALSATSTTVSTGPATVNSWFLDNSNDVGLNFKKAVSGIIEDFNSTGLAAGNSQGGVWTSSTPKQSFYYQRSAFNGPCNAMRLVPSAGNITGWFSLEGWRG